MPLKTIRLWLWVAVAALGITAATAVIMLRSTPPAQAAFGSGDYALLDQNGNAVDQTMFAGHPSALFFGFTHCPDVCPTTLAEMAGWFEALGEEGQDLKGYFVTVDPERDTPAMLGEYVSWMSDDVTGITGTPEEIAKMTKAWGVLAEKVPLEGGDYTMNHTASVFLLNAKGEFEGTIAYGEGSQSALGKLRNLIAKS